MLQKFKTLWLAVRIFLAVSMAMLTAVSLTGSAYQLPTVISGKEIAAPVVEFVETRIVAMGENATVADWVKVVKNGFLSNGTAPVDTSVVGTVQQIAIVKLSNGKTVEVPFNITVVSQTAPIVNVADKITVICGKKIDLLKQIVATDSIGKALVPTVEGQYDLNKTGKYSLTVRATDSAGNTTAVPFTLCVVAQQKAKSAEPVKQPKNLPKAVSTENVIRAKKGYSSPYWVVVYREACTVVVYKADQNGKFTVPVRVSVCSPGSGDNTTVGTFSMSAKYRWCMLIGPCYGQYSIRFNGHILFHSVPYQERKNTTLKYWLYNRLGKKDSLGCVRLTTVDAKWLYDNCPIGTSVTVTTSGLPKGITKPKAPYISASDKRRGWDPTDPDPKNPWGKYTDPGYYNDPVTPSSSKPSSSSVPSSSSAQSSTSEQSGSEETSASEESGGGETEDPPGTDQETTTEISGTTE